MQAYLTGADYSGGPQSNAALSLGSFRSLARATSLTVRRFGTMTGVRIVFVAGYNGPGFASLTAPTTGSLRWTAPGGTAGASVSIANGETKMLLDGTNADKYVIVQRTSSANLRGSETIQLLETLNNVTGGSNFTEAESTAGEAKYRGLMLVNAGALSVTGLTVWIDPGYDTRARVAKDTVVSDEIQDIADEFTQPTGLTWVSGTTEGTGLVIGTLAAGASIGLWIERYVAAGATANADVRTVIRYSYTVSTVKRYGSLRGVSRIAEAGLAGQLLYLGDGSEPDIDGAATDTATTFPHAMSALTAGHTYYLRRRNRNKYGLLGAATESEIFRVALDSSLSGAPPSGPSIVSLQPVASGCIQVEAVYHPSKDGAANQATHWLLYVSTDGADPDPDVETPTVTAMATATLSNGERAPMRFTATTSGYLEATPVRVLVRTRRVEVIDEVTVTTDSENTTAYEAFSEWFGTASAKGASAALGWVRGLTVTPPAPPAATVWIDQAKNIYWQCLPGQVRLWADTSLIWNARYISDDNAYNGIWTPYAVRGPAVTGTGTGAVEIVSWTVGDKRIAFNVAGQRKMLVDVTNEEIYLESINNVEAMLTSRANVPLWERYGALCLQVWDAITCEYVTVASLMAAGDLRTALPWNAMATQAECL